MIGRNRQRLHHRWIQHTNGEGTTNQREQSKARHEHRAKGSTAATGRIMEYRTKRHTGRIGGPGDELNRRHRGAGALPQAQMNACERVRSGIRSPHE